MENASDAVVDENVGTGAKATRGAALLLGTKLLGRGLDFISLIVLTHILKPVDFGIVSLAMSVIYLTEAVFELPLYQALVVLDRVDRAHTDTAFTITLIRGLVICACVMAISLPFAAFYHDGRLALLLAALSLAPALRGMLSPGMARFGRELDFSRESMLELVGKVAALGVAATVAITTRSYWAVAAATISNAVVIMAASYVISPYRPRLTLSKWNDFKEFLGWSSGAQIIGAINWQYDRLILGRVVSPQTLGAFAIASDLVAIPSQAIVVPLSRPLLSAFVAVRNRSTELRRIYRFSNSAIFMVVFPIFFELSMLSKEIVHTILGKRWDQSIGYIAVLSIPPIVASLAEGMSALVMALKRTHIYMRLNLIELAFKLPIITAAALLYGAMGACWARVLVAVIMMLVYLDTTKRILEVPFRDFLFANARTLFAGLAACLLIEIVRDYVIPESVPGLLKLPVLGSVGVLGYLAMLFGSWWMIGRRDAAVEALVLRKISQKIAARSL